MRMEFPLRFADYRAAMILHTTRTLLGRIWYVSMMWIAPAVAVFCLIPCLIVHLQRVAHFDLESLGFLMVAAFCIGVPALQLSDLRKQFNFRFPKSSEQKAVLEINSEEVASTLAGKDEVRIPWSEVTDFFQNDRMTLIYVGKNLLFAPTNVFSTSDRDELNVLVARHVVVKR
jgi:hypothetical protein